MTRIMQVIDGGMGAGYVTLLEDGTWWRCDYVCGPEKGEGRWMWMEMPQPPAPACTREAEAGGAKEPGTPDYSIALHAFSNWLAKCEGSSAWPTIVALLERELADEVVVSRAGERGMSVREGKAHAHGERQGLLRGAEAMRQVVAHVSGGRLPEAVSHVLMEIAKNLEGMAEALRP